MSLSNIEAVRARNGLPSSCPACGQLSLMVLESRDNGSARRRRKACIKCGHRLTTYEITQEEYRQLKGKGKLKPRPKPSATPHEFNCSTCVHWEESGCGLDFPEAGGWFADECSCYQAVKEPVV
jgi:transcription elongation factor Elf1